MKKILLIFSIIVLGGIFIFPQNYVGPEKCLQCHPSKANWRTSMHANGYSVVLDDAHSMENLYGIINDYDQNGIDDFKDGLDFNTINSVFDPYKPNAPILSYNNGYFIQIGQVAHKVYLTYGGSGLYKQRYAVKILTSEGESADYYVSPIQYNEKTNGYVLYHADAWYDNNNLPIYTPSSTKSDAAGNSRSLAKGCSGCHVPGLQMNPQNSDGEWTFSGGGVFDESAYAGFNNIYDIDGDGDLDQINVGCEACHGPGEDHAVNFPADTSKIINPAKDLSPNGANHTCGMCHSRGKSLPDNTFSFPYDDTNLTGWAPGDYVFNFYTDGGGYYNDNFSSKKHHQQFFDFYKSSKPTFQFHNVTCYECHDVHNAVKHHIVEEIEEEDSTGAPLTIATENDNNTLCLACHATHGAFENIPKEWVADYQNHINDIGPIVSAHTNHSYDPEGSGESRCSKCHQPKSIKSAINYDIHSHTFEVLQPEKTIIFEMPNSCAVSCHRGIENGGTPLFNIGVDGDLGDWTEATDIALADTLMHWYGPGGVWWDHTVSVEISDPNIPDNYLLSQNYPNPFNPSTKISFSVPVESHVSIVVYDIVGREVETLVNENMPSGNYSLTWNAEGLTSGVYFYRMESQNFVEVKKMIMMK